MNEWIAEREIVCIGRDGHRQFVGVRVGRPRHIGGGAWECSIALDGLYERLEPGTGKDSLRALVAGIVALRELLEHYVSEGGRVLSPGDDSELGVHRLFAGVA